MDPDAAVADTVHSYDLIVDDYERRTSDPGSDYTEFRAAFVREARPGGSLVDLGCGPGRDARYFDGRGLHVVGLDASAGMAGRARRNGTPVVLGDLRALPFPAGRLDGVWSSASLLHVPREDVDRTLLGWATALRPGGVLGLSTSLGESDGWEQVPYEPASQPREEELRRWFVHHDATELLAALGHAGFEVLSRTERQSHRRWLQVLARRARA